MNFFTKYIVPLALIILAVVNFLDERWVEGLLYLSVGSGFSVLNLLKAGFFKSHLKFWNILSWALIVLAILLFLLVLRMDAYDI